MNELTDYSKFIAYSNYARVNWDTMSRESWPDTVHRYVHFMTNHIWDNYKVRIPDEQIYDAILKMKVMPSMRQLKTAGPALDKCNVAGYNCSYMPVDTLRSFDECLYLSMCGTGIGFSVESKYVNCLPEVPETLKLSDKTIIVPDSREGWADSFRQLLFQLYSGNVPNWDLSQLRPKGAPLKTFGGSSSGPEPLNRLFVFTVRMFDNAKGRKLYPIECHDLMCMAGDCAVSGGSRRTALISLSDVDDHFMRNAKSGNWWVDHPYRALANNSAVYDRQPNMSIMMREWSALYESRSGERGIFNRSAAKRQAESTGRRASDCDFGTNPCSEIILRPFQFCNLTEVVVRPYHVLNEILDLVRIATIIGTLQATLTDFKYIRKVWKDNTEAERLLGVSLTGIMDNVLLNNTHAHLPEILQMMREVAIETNKTWAAKLGIPASAAITCVKPSGTVSQLVDSASGIHPRYSKYYIRTVRGANENPVTKFMKAQGIPNEPDVMDPENTTVFSFPFKAEEDAITRNEVSAIQHLELWKTYQEHWCEHKPSITVQVGKKEWMSVGAWVYDNFDIISGIAFLPKDEGEHSYAQAPYQETDEEGYLQALAAMPEKVDWELMKNFETNLHEVNRGEFACTADHCEIVDIK